MAQDKVCPICGNTNFKAQRLTIQQVIVDGYGEIIDVKPDSDKVTSINQIECCECKSRIPSVESLVAENTFHNIM